MKNPTIYFDGKKRNYTELEEAFWYEIDEYDTEKLQELCECMNELKKCYDIVDDGFTWNGDDMYYKNTKMILKQIDSKEIEDMKEFYAKFGA